MHDPGLDSEPQKIIAMKTKGNWRNQNMVHRLDNCIVSFLAFDQRIVLFFLSKCPHS